MNEKQKLLMQIQSYDFAILEAALYLDSHPRDQKALDYYNNYAMLRRQAVEMYERNYGPLTIYGNNNKNEWHWADEPWPWECED